MRSLAELRDIRLPLPPPDGGGSEFLVAAGLLAVLAALTVIWVFRFSPAACAKRTIASAERRWRRDRNAVALVQVLAGLVRARLSKRDTAVCALAGPVWRSRLELGGLPPAVAEALASWPYRAAPTFDVASPEIEALVAAIRRWLAACE